MKINFVIAHAVFGIENFSHKYTYGIVHRCKINHRPVHPRHNKFDWVYVRGEISTIPMSIRIAFYMSTCWICEISLQVLIAQKNIKYLTILKWTSLNLRWLAKKISLASWPRLENQICCLEKQNLSSKPKELSTYIPSLWVYT